MGIIDVKNPFPMPYSVISQEILSGMPLVAKGTHDEHSTGDQLTIAVARSRDDGSKDLDNVPHYDPASATHHHAEDSDDDAPKP